MEKTNGVRCEDGRGAPGEGEEWVVACQQRAVWRSGPPQVPGAQGMDFVNVGFGSEGLRDRGDRDHGMSGV